MAQHIGAQHDAALAFHPEKLSPRLCIHFRECGGFRPGRITYAVIARQVRTRLRRADDVIATDRIRCMRQAHFFHFTSKLPQDIKPGMNLVPGLRLQSLEILLGDPDLHALYRFPHLGLIVVYGRKCAGRIEFIAAGNCLKNRSCIGNASCKGPNVIKTAGECNQPIAAHAPVGRRHTHYAAKGRGLTNGSACIGAKRNYRRALSHYRCGSAARTARYAI